MMRTPIIETRDLRCTFSVRGRLFGAARSLRAVDGVSLTIQKGEVVGLVGESGCGKSTLANLLLGLQSATAGSILVDGEPIEQLPRRQLARRIQPVFQDPYSSLNPRRDVASIIGLPLQIHRVGTPAERPKRVREMMDLVGLARTLERRYSNQLSGGQRQRVAVARALIMRPEVVICDEPTSALDVSVQSQILNLLQDLREELDLTYVLISHNLAVVERLASRVAVMYLGRVVEEAPTEMLFASPRHPYTEALLASVLTPDPHLGVPDNGLGTSYPDPTAPPTGCSFHPRCPKAFGRCPEDDPRLTDKASRRIACHLIDCAGAAAA